MKITIEGNPKEIAALVVELQERRNDCEQEHVPFARDSDVVLCTQDIVKHK